MQLSPLQSRLVASVAASITLLILYFTLLPPKFAFAADVSNVPDIVFDDLSVEEVEMGPRDGLDGLYEPQFAAFDRSIIGRAENTANELSDNVPATFSLKPGTIGYFVFQSGQVARRAEPEILSRAIPGQEEVEGVADGGESSRSEAVQGELLKRQQSTRPVFISANTCVQPQAVENSDTTIGPPQLNLLFSADSNDQFPNRTKGSTQTDVFNEGAVMHKVDATGAVYFSIEAPDLSDDFSGSWEFEVAASTDGWYHSYENDNDNDEQLIWMVDHDSSGALLMTTDLTEDEDEVQTIMESGPPYALFVDEMGSRSTNGVRKSFCGLRKYAQIAGMQNSDQSNLVSVAMTTRGPGNLPKQQFWLGGLNSSTTYSGILVRVGGSPPLRKRQNGGGGSTGGVQVLQQTQFDTRTGDNCKVITDLDFCDEVSYAVPANEDKFNITELARFYDNYARSMYSNFEKVLMQVPCQAHSTSRYSLVRDCEDCEDAYKRWLCTVAIPRCEDFSATTDGAHVRAASFPFPNGTRLPDSDVQDFERMGPAYLNSRNKIIDDQVAPGPYREILPCEDVCYQLVQSCPASIGFQCPLRGNPFFNTSYAIRKEGVPSSCNALPSLNLTSLGSTIQYPSWMGVAAGMAALTAFL